MLYGKETILKEYGKISGAEITWNGRKIDIPLTSDQDDTMGRLIMISPADPIIFNLIDIRSQVIPEKVADPGITTRALKINYCAAGRCELRLQSGECTYLTAGEIAVDTGQALNTFYYPTGEYRGFEIVVPVDDLPGEYHALGEQLSSPDAIFNICREFDHPWIRNADGSVSRMYDRFRAYINEYKSCELLLLGCLETIALLSGMDYSQASVRRTYCTASQVKIAKRTKKRIMSDLSVRLTARELAKEFGISETSLKNYFRSVYGCGYAEYQLTARMRKAAKLLEETEDRVSDIGQTVGYATQAKFGAAFKECYGITPLEYRRRSRLEEG